MVHQAVKRVGDIVGHLVDHGLLPAGSGLQPEDGGRHCLASLSECHAKQVLGDPGIGLGVTVVEFVAVVLAQGLGIAADQTGDVGLWNAEAGEGLDLAPLRLGLGMCRPAHRSDHPVQHDRLAFRRTWLLEASSRRRGFFGYLGAIRIVRLAIGLQEASFRVGMPSGPKWPQRTGNRLA
jgi:hypothetical protein